MATVVEPGDRLEQVVEEFVTNAGIEFNKLFPAYCDYPPIGIRASLDVDANVLAYAEIPRPSAFSSRRSVTSAWSSRTAPASSRSVGASARGVPEGHSGRFSGRAFAAHTDAVLARGFAKNRTTGVRGAAACEHRPVTDTSAASPRAPG